MAKEAEDTGLGLSVFLEGEPSQEEEKTEEVAEKKEEVEQKPEETKGEEKTEESPIGEKVEEPKEEEPSSPTESEEESFRKRYHDTAKYANDEHQARLEAERQNAELQRVLAEYQARTERIEKMQTQQWTEEDERIFQQGQKIDPVMEEQMRDQATRIVSSRDAAYRLYGSGNKEKGQEIVYKTLFAPDAPFKSIENRKEVINRVMYAINPVIEAMDIVEEYSFKARYGDTPDQQIANIKNEFRKEIEDEVTKKVLENIKKSEAQTKGISEARGQVAGGKEPVDQPYSLDEVSPHLS